MTDILHLILISITLCQCISILIFVYSEARHNLFKNTRWTAF